MKVTVAIPTRGRASALPRLFKALEDQTLSPSDFEVVVVDDASPDDTAEVLATLAANTKLDVRVLSVDGPRNRGQGAARNLAWRAAKGDVVAFTDDDCIPIPTWLEEGLAAMAGDRRIVVGRTVPNPDHEHLRGPFARTISVESPLYFETCNIFYRRDDLDAASGFDEVFTAGGAHGGEDTDLGWRVRDLGSVPVFAADAIVFHDIKPNDWIGAARQALRWTGIPRAVQRHPEEARRLLIGRVFWKWSHPYALAAIAGLLLASRVRWAAALGLPWIVYRVRVAPLTDDPRRRWLVLPGAFVVDVAEIAAMIR